MYAVTPGSWFQTCSTPERTFGKLDPGTPQLEQLYQEGRADYQNGKYDDAVRKFAYVVEVDPTHLNALINWGVALSSGNKPEAAVPKFQQALSREPNNAATLYNLGDAATRARQLRADNEKRRQKGQQLVYPEENFYGWFINDRLDELRKLL